MNINNKTLFMALIVLALVVGGGSVALLKRNLTAEQTITASNDIVADLTEVAPSAAADPELKKTSNDPFGKRTLGNPDAPIKLEEFASLTCGHCAHFHNDTFPELKEKFIDTGIVHFTFTEFPLNAPALQASMVARCMPDDRYFAFVGLLFKTQEQWAFSQDWEKALRQNAKLAGMNDESYDACVGNEKLKQHIADTMQEKAAQYTIDSTPSFVFNDGVEKLVGAQAIESFTQKIEALK